MKDKIVNFEIGSVTLSDIEADVASIKMDKDNAIKLLTLAKTLSLREDEAKKYLQTKCGETDIYTSGMLHIQKIEGRRTTVTNSKIRALQDKIEVEKKKIAKDPTLGDGSISTYFSFKIKRVL